VAEDIEERVVPISVLVVEDEPVVRLNMCLHLEEQGFDVEEAGNADEAITVLNARSDIQVMFTDIDMPGSMDGLKLSAFVRDRWPPVRIVVTSGKRLIEVTDLPDGSVFFAKPYSLVDVADSIVRLVAEFTSGELRAPR
jgi:CheY-like chemotaxis protein